MATARLFCKWLAPGGPILSLAMCSGCSGFISGKESCLGRNGCLPAENTACSLMSGRGWSHKSAYWGCKCTCVQFCHTKMKIWCIEGMSVLKLVSSESLEEYTTTVMWFTCNIYVCEAAVHWILSHPTAPIWTLGTWMMIFMVVCSEIAAAHSISEPIP